jgi:PEGA domain-containing protein
MTRVAPLFVLGLLACSQSAVAQSNGVLKVTSFPSSAEVLIDGVSSGKLTPMSVSVAVGDHTVTVRISGSGWNPDTRIVTIASGNNDLSVTLLPILTGGAPGPPGATGTSVAFVGYFGGNAHGCPNGGAIYTAGAVETYVCNGINGTNVTSTAGMAL